MASNRQARPSRRAPGTRPWRAARVRVLAWMPRRAAKLCRRTSWLPCSGAAALQSASGGGRVRRSGCRELPAVAVDSRRPPLHRAAGEGTVTRRGFSPSDHQCLDQVPIDKWVGSLFRAPPIYVGGACFCTPVRFSVGTDLATPAARSSAVFFSRSRHSQRVERVRRRCACGPHRRAAERPCGASASAPPCRPASGRSAALARRGGSSPGYPRQDAHACSTSRSRAWSTPGGARLALRRLAARPRAHHTHLHGRGVASSTAPPSTRHQFDCRRDPCRPKPRSMNARDRRYGAQPEHWEPVEPDIPALRSSARAPRRGCAAAPRGRVAAAAASPHDARRARRCGC